MPQRAVFSWRSRLSAIWRRTAIPRCPRCERDVAPEDLEDAALDELRLIDPHLDRYAHRALGGEIAVCAACGQQLDALAEEMEAYRRLLIRRWPTPPAYRDALMDDQCLSRTFEAVRDTAIMEVLALLPPAQTGNLARRPLTHDSMDGCLSKSSKRGEREGGH